MRPPARALRTRQFNLWFYSNTLNIGGGKYDIAYGRDEAMLGGLAIGAKGSIGNGFNFAAGVYQRLRRAFFAGDLAAARVEQQRATQWRRPPRPPMRSSTRTRGWTTSR